MIRPYICSRCSTRRLFTSSARRRLQETPNPTETISVPKSPPPSSGYAQLHSRRLISLYGPDAPSFLQGLTTANILFPPSASSQNSSSKTSSSLANPLSGFYSAFLNAQGRILHDVFIYPAASIASIRESTHDTSSYLVECDASELDSLYSLLKKYKLRAKVNLRRMDPEEWTIWSVWDDTVYSELGPIQGPSEFSSKSSNIYLSASDNRAPGFGYRLLLPYFRHPSGLPRQKEDLTHPLIPTTTEQREVREQTYHLRRILRGIAEGQANEGTTATGGFVKGQSLPLESNLDYMGALDFRKGCYVGQELTIRTYHTGVVRKRILPVILYEGKGTDESEIAEPLALEFKPEEAQEYGGALPNLAADIERIDADGKVKAQGKWLGGIGNVGLALCRLSAMTGEASQGQTFKVTNQAGKDFRVKAFVPSWFEEKAEALQLKR
ncbi:ccr4 associated factor [Agyrium rufum]|nr:ccr4 associated factor [Agyrium rufum]